MNDQTKCLVPWSGGVDSTMALVKALEVAAPGNVRTVSFVVDQIPKHQREGEARARERITKWLDKKHGFRFQSNTMEIKTGSPGFAGRCPQPIMWLGLVAATCYEKEWGVFGWLKTDYPPDMIHNLKCAWKHLAAENGAHETPWLPFIEKSKAAVQEECHKFGLLDLIWYCEDAPGGKSKKFQPCGTCECCLSFKAGELERELRWPAKKAKVSKRPKKKSKRKKKK